LTHGSLFDGAGGLRRGFEQAGITTNWSIELTRGQDIHTTSNLPYVDIISGGPPCQRTSEAAAFHQQRNYFSLWPEMLRIVKETNPRWVVVEQPKGGRSIIIQASQELQRIGYGCAGRIIDSRHWLPQTRSRWILVGWLGRSGMDVWNSLYPSGERVEGQDRQGGASLRFDGNCSDCLRGGVYSRISARKPALIGAGNAVSVPVAKWLGERILSIGGISMNSSASLIA
jgi:site-specific DNA-cytosine methylase